MAAMTVDDLRSLALFEGLPNPSLQWFCEHGLAIVLAEGERMFEAGQRADYMFVVVRGTIERFEKIGGQWLKVAVTRTGEVTGMLPYSRMTHYPGHTVAAERSVVLRLHKSDFSLMLETCPEVGQRLVAIMSDRVRSDVRLEQQAERMAALGKLAAGLAHELNNPAAAARRAAQDLRGRWTRLHGMLAALVHEGIDDTRLAAIERLRRRAEPLPERSLSALERGDREDRLLTWLEDHGVEEAWEVAGALTDTAVTIEELDELARALSDNLVPLALAWIAEWTTGTRTIDEIAATTSRVSDLVASVKTYSHMDRSVEHKPTDVREGLDSTVTVLAHRIEDRAIRLERAYQSDLPTIPANAGELNQVWTNLIDNALDAMPDGGVLRLTASVREDALEVGIIDNGAGIPDHVRPHIFEPFFTTKDVGEGTGLGLDIARRIVQAHGGQIDVDSPAGWTAMRVLLPLSAPAPKEETS